MKCKNCGKNVVLKDSFCSHCGSNLLNTEHKEISEQMYTEIVKERFKNDLREFTTKWYGKFALAIGVENFRRSCKYILDHPSDYSLPALPTDLDVLINFKYIEKV